MNCDKLTALLTFYGSSQPHYWCYGCGSLWVEEMGYLLHCTNAKHISQVGYHRKTA